MPGTSPADECQSHRFNAGGFTDRLYGKFKSFVNKCPVY